MKMYLTTSGIIEFVYWLTPGDGNKVEGFLLHLNFSKNLNEQVL